MLQAKIDAALAEADLESTAAVQALKTEIGELRAKLGALAEAELGTADASDLSPELDALQERLAKLEAALPGLEDADRQGRRRGASRGARHRFRQSECSASARGVLYAAELDALQALLARMPTILACCRPTPRPASRRGRAVRAFARREMPLRDGDAATPGRRILARPPACQPANGRVKVRRVDAAPGDGTSAALARAEAQLDQGDLAGAIKEVEAFGLRGARPFSTWLEQARARQAPPAV